MKRSGKGQISFLTLWKICFNEIRSFVIVSLTPRVLTANFPEINRINLRKKERKKEGEKKERKKNGWGLMFSLAVEFDRRIPKQIKKILRENNLITHEKQRRFKCLYSSQPQKLATFHLSQTPLATHCRYGAAYFRPGGFWIDLTHWCYRLLINSFFLKTKALSSILWGYSTFYLAIFYLVNVILSNLLKAMEINYHYLSF